MPIEQRAEFVISLDGDDSKIRSIFNAFTKTVKDSAADLERTTSNIVLFKGLKENLDVAKTAATGAVDGLAKLREAIKSTQNAGDTVGKGTAASLRDAEKAAASANKEFAKQQTAVDKMAKSLVTAGVNLKALGTEEIRLATAAKQAAAAEEARQAAAVLGIKTSRDTTAEIARQVAAFNTLKTSGLATVQDLANAEKALNANIKAANASLAGGKAVAADFGASLRTGLTGALIPFAGITGAVLAVVSGFKDAIQASREFSQGLAEIGTVTNLSKGQLDALGEGARQISVTLGVDLNAALKGLFDLIRSGVPEGNALEVLRISAEAAKASLVDVGVGVKATNLLLDSFGANVSDLPSLFDKITKGAHDGGASLTEFANSAGPLLNIARATGVSFDDLLAVLTVLVDKSGNAEKSFTDLTKILQKLDTVDVKNKLADLGITGGTLADTFRQIGERGLSLNDVLDLGVATAGKSAASLATLTNNAKLVPEEFDKIKGSADEVKRSLDTVYNSPKEVSDRFNARLHETALAFGDIFGSGSKLQSFATDFLASFNKLYLGVRPVSVASESLNTDLGALIVGLTGVPLPAEAAAASLKAASDAAATAAKQFADAAIQANEVKAKLTGLNAALLADVQALQAALARDITDAAARADAQIAALDRSKAAESATAAATLAIRLKSAADTFALIQTSEAKITAAVIAANAAREKAAKASGESQKKIDADSNAVRLAAVGQTLAAYQALYAQLIALAQTAAARVQGFEEARVSIAQKVEDEIRGIRFDALTGLDQYVARLAEVDRLVSEGRKKAAEGDTAAAKQFFDQAITEAKGLTKVVNENGVVLVTATQAQTDKIGKLKEIQDAANKSFGDQAEAAKKGGDEAIKQADLIKPHIADLQAQYDALKASVAEGLKLKVETDEASVAAAFAKLDELTKDRTVTVFVDTVNRQGQPVSAPAPDTGGGTGFARGGPVRRAPAARGFARGGPVFRTPTWFKVPGTGSGDTVPARLATGSFVVRKSASRYYGDGVMGALARGGRVRGYAAGGSVTKDEVWRWAEKVFGTRDPFGVGAGGGKPSPGGQFPGRGQFPDQGQFPGGTGKLRDKDFQKDVHPPISFDARPIPEELITAINVLTYAREMLNSVGQTNRLLGSLGPAIFGGITAVEANPNDKAAITALLQAAETIGSNPFVFAMGGKTASVIEKLTPTWFVDWLTKRGMLDPSGKITAHGKSVDISGFAQSFFGSTEFAQKFFGGSGQAQRFFGSQGRPLATGGGVDSVLAKLTPGEFVFQPRAVSHYGGQFMEAMNRMAIPRDLLAGMMAPPMPHFAEGGPVLSAGGSPTFREGQPGAQRGGTFAGATFNFMAAAGDLLSEANVTRYIVPVFRRLEQKSR